MVFKTTYLGIRVGLGTITTVKTYQCDFDGRTWRWIRKKKHTSAKTTNRQLDKLTRPYTPAGVTSIVNYAVPS
jgi:hypothetical protein